MKASAARAAARPRTLLASLNSALASMMESDDRVYVLGEDIVDPYGGAFKVTKGLSSRFPERVLATPISEAAIVGMASGMALRGLRPIAEIMFGDFIALAADQLINHAAKFRWMYNEQVRVPLVVRTPSGGRRGYGPTHSQSLEKHLLGVPGMWVVAPHLLGDPGALLRQATLDCDDPVLFVESKLCYGRALVDSVEGMNGEVLGGGDTFATTYLRHGGARAGSDGLIFCYGGMTPLGIDAVLRLRDVEGLNLDLAVLSQLSPLPREHIETVLASSQPGVCVYVEEAAVEAGWSAEMTACVEELRAAASRPAIRHLRIGSKATPVPSSRELEARSLPQADDIVDAVVDCF